MPRGRHRRGKCKNWPPDDSVLQQVPPVINQHHGPLITSATTTATTITGAAAAGSRDQVFRGPLQPITRFCRPQGSTMSSSEQQQQQQPPRAFMDNRFIAEVLKLLQDASPSRREQLFWDVYAQLADYFGQLHLPLRASPNTRYLTRLTPNPLSQLALYSGVTSRYQQEFEEVGELGHGGFGRVVKARNKLDGCLYAVKIIAIEELEEESSDKYLQEVRALATLSSPRVVRYHNAWLQLNLWPQHNTLTTTAQDRGSFLGDESVAGSSSSEDGSSVLDQRNEELSEDDSVVFQHSGTHSPTLHLSKHSRQPGSRRSHSRGLRKTSSRALLPFRPRRVVLPKKLLFIQMGLCGRSLKDWLDRRNARGLSLDSAKCLNIFLETVEALSYIHPQGYIHRDIKPANILFTLEEDHVQLGDFGLAKLNVRPSVMSSEVLHNSLAPLIMNSRHIGTPMYTAPEVSGGNYGPKSDMYSLGIILLELFHPFTTTHQRLRVLQSLREQRRLDQTFTQDWPHIAHWVMRLTDPDPYNRPSSTELLTSSLFYHSLHRPLSHTTEGHSRIQELVEGSALSPTNTPSEYSDFEMLELDKVKEEEEHIINVKTGSYRYSAVERTSLRGDDRGRKCFSDDVRKCLQGYNDDKRNCLERGDNDDNKYLKSGDNGGAMNCFKGDDDDNCLKVDDNLGARNCFKGDDDDNCLEDNNGGATYCFKGDDDDNCLKVDDNLGARNCFKGYNYDDDKRNCFRSEEKATLQEKLELQHFDNSQTEIGVREQVRKRDNTNFWESISLATGGSSNVFPITERNSSKEDECEGLVTLVTNEIKVYESALNITEEFAFTSETSTKEPTTLQTNSSFTFSSPVSAKDKEEIVALKDRVSGPRGENTRDLLKIGAMQTEAAFVEVRTDGSAAFPTTDRMCMKSETAVCREENIEKALGTEEAVFDMRTGESATFNTIENCLEDDGDIPMLESAAGKISFETDRIEKSMKESAFEMLHESASFIAVERSCSKDEEIAVLEEEKRALREKNIALQKRVEELEVLVKRLTSRDSLSPEYET